MKKNLLVLFGASLLIPPAAARAQTADQMKQQTMQNLQEQEMGQQRAWDQEQQQEMRERQFQDEQRQSDYERQRAYDKQQQEENYEMRQLAPQPQPQDTLRGWADCSRRSVGSAPPAVAAFASPMGHALKYELEDNDPPDSLMRRVRRPLKSTFSCRPITKPPRYARQDGATYPACK